MMTSDTNENKCDRCGAERVASMSTKCSDMCFYGMSDGEDHDGYAPGDMGIGDGGDYIAFAWCLYCGKIQGEFPLPPCKAEGDA